MAFVRRWGAARQTACASAVGAHVFVATASGLDRLTPHGERDLQLRDARLGGLVVALLATRASHEACEALALDLKPSATAELVLALEGVDETIGVLHVDGKRATVVKVLPAPFPGATGLAMLGDKLFISDMERHCVHWLAASDGAQRGSFGTRGAGADQLCRPQAVVACAERQVLFVADAGNSRVQMMSPTGRFLRSFGSEGPEIGMLADPRGLSLSSAGTVLAVCDYGNNRVQGFDTALIGKVAWLLDDGLDGPYGVAFDSDDDILVSDQQGAQWFAPPGDSDCDSSTASSSSSKFSAADDDGEGCSDASSDSGSDFESDFEPESADEDSAGAGHIHTTVNNNRHAENGDEDEDEDEDEGEREGPQHSGHVSPLLASPGGRTVPESTTLASPASEHACLPGSASKTSRKVRQAYLREQIGVEEKAEQLAEEVAGLEGELSRLQAIRAAQEQRLAEPLPETKFQDGVEPTDLLSLGPASARLQTAESIAACTNSLVLEERALDLQILNSDLVKRIEPLTKEEVQATSRVRQARRQLQDAKLKAANSFPSSSSSRHQDSEDSAQKRHESLQRELAALREQIASEARDGAGQLSELEAERAALARDLARLGENLHSVRLRARPARRQSGYPACR